MSKSKSPATTRRSASAASASLVYVYAAVAGQPPARVLARLGPLPGGGPPRLLGIDSKLSIVIADVPADTYNREAIEQRLSDLDWVGACGGAHHAVADALFDTHLVVPLRLFTLFASEARARAALRRRRPGILKAFARLQGRQEFVLRVGPPDLARIGAEAAAPSASGTAETGTGFLRSKATSRRETTERNARVSQSVSEVFEQLSAIAVDARARTAPPGTNLLLDAAFLVNTRRSAAFRRTLTRAASDLLRDGCPVSLTGPWPPYSFASTD
jgi:hypothetical protein